MKKIIFATIALGALVASASCKKEEAFAPSQNLTITLNDDFFTDEDGSKVTLNGLDFAWEKTDTIGVVGTNNYTKLAPLTNDGNCKTFSGTIPGEAAGAEYYVVYPYAAQLQRVTTENRLTDIPFSPFQTAVKGGLPLITYNLTEGVAGKPAIVLIGTTTDNGTKATLKCQNALLKFKFASSDIKEVHFTMTSPHIAGYRVWYTPSTGKISPQDQCGETQTIVVKPESGCFEAGEYYYAAITPASYKLTFRAFCSSSDKNYAKITNISFNCEAGKIYTVGNKGLDEIGDEETVTSKDLTLTFDFTNGTVFSDVNETALPNYAEGKTTFKCWTKGTNSSYIMDISNSKKSGLQDGCLTLEQGNYPSFQIPAIGGYTIKSAEIEFAELPIDNNSKPLCIYWGNRKVLDRSHILGDIVPIGSNKASTTTQMCTSYYRYFLRICRKTSTGYSNTNNTGKPIKVKSVTFHYEYGSWHGSWTE